MMPALVTLALLAIDLDYVWTLAASGVFSQATWIELLVIGVGVVKTGAMFAFGRLRAAGVAVVLDIYGAELLLLPFVAIAYALFGFAYAPAFVSQLVIGWVIGASTGGLAFTAFRIGRSMFRSEGLAKVIPLAMVSSEAGLLFVNSAVAAGAPGGSIDTIIRSAATGYGAISVTAPIYFDFAALYVLLLLYATMRSGGTLAYGPKYVLAAVVATAVTAAWAVAGPQLVAVAPTYRFVPPALAIVAVSWVLGYGS